MKLSRLSPNGIISLYKRGKENSNVNNVKKNVRLIFFAVFREMYVVKLTFIIAFTQYCIKQMKNRQYLYFP